MTAQRLGRLIAAGDGDAVGAAVVSSPRLLTATVERDGQGGWTPLHVTGGATRAGRRRTTPWPISSCPAVPRD